MQYSTGKHCVYYHRYHLVWSTKYRFKVLQGPLLAMQCPERGRANSGSPYVDDVPCVSPLRDRNSGPNERQLNDQHRRRVRPEDQQHLGKAAGTAANLTYIN